MNNDIASIIQQQVREAYNSASPLSIQSNNTKAFYGNVTEGTPLITSQHRGIISYEPTELVLTARAGTPLDEIEQLLDKNNQQLAFEPPFFKTGDKDNEDETRCATLGGTIACGFSGPARADKGAARDFVLGCEIINGKGEQMKFGGEVMKNVAGYDVSRLVCGSLGTLAVVLNVSLKVLPKPETETSLGFVLSQQQAMQKLQQWKSLPYPITASCYYNGTLTIRLCGNQQAVKATYKKIGGEKIQNSTAFWQSIREQQHDFFITDKPIWRISVSPAAKLNIDMDKNTGSLSEWHGALHWVKTNTPGNILRQHVEQLGGHAIVFRNATAQEQIFHPLPDTLFRIHRNIKHAFDPKNILNRNKMYPF